MYIIEETHRNIPGTVISNSNELETIKYESIGDQMNKKTIQ